jgi:hypothetical protein
MTRVRLALEIPKARLRRQPNSTVVQCRMRSYPRDTAQSHAGRDVGIPMNDVINRQGVEVHSTEVLVPNCATSRNSRRGALEKGSTRRWASRNPVMIVDAIFSTIISTR